MKSSHLFAMGLGFVTTVVGLACAAERPYIWAQNLPPTAEAEAGDNTIHARDSLAIVVRDQPALSGEFVVRDDGGYMHPMLGNVVVAGRTPADVERELQPRLAALVVHPQVTVTVARVGPVRVSVVGEVRTPGLYELSRDRSLVAALAAAGWLTDYASRDRIFVVRKGNGEARIRFRAGDVTAADGDHARFRLRDADVVVVE